MKNKLDKIIYIPEADQRELEQMVNNALFRDAEIRSIVAACLVKRYNELRKVEINQKVKITQINGRR